MNNKFSHNIKINMSKCKVKKQAFTLAEILITLSILGVIAAITIPSTIQKFQDKVQITAFKKAYSMLNSAFDIAIAENGPLDTWQWPVPQGANYTPENGTYIGDILKKYLNLQKYCGSTNDCWSYLKNDEYKDVSGNTIFFRNSWKGGKMILKNGTRIAFTMPTVDTLQNGRNPQSQVYVDTNGEKGPNRLGYDIFTIGYYKNGLTVSGGYFGINADHCNPKAAVQSNRNWGHGCTYWILKHGNMDYKYRDVSSEW